MRPSTEAEDRALLDRLIELLDQIDTPMIEVTATVDQLRRLHEHASDLEEWARNGLKTKGIHVDGPGRKDSLS